MTSEHKRDKRDAIIITKRGKPVAKSSPTGDTSGPIYGAMNMKRLAKIHGDLTEPLGAEWEALHQSRYA